MEGAREGVYAAGFTWVVRPVSFFALLPAVKSDPPGCRPAAGAKRVCCATANAQDRAVITGGGGGNRDLQPLPGGKRARV